MINQISEELKPKSKDYQSILHLLAWLLTISAICSCLIRTDYNVLYGLIMIIGLNRHFISQRKYFGKIMIHVTAIIALLDLIWMCVILPYWGQASHDNGYWKNLHGLHVLASILSFVELILKVAIAYFLVMDYSKHSPINTLFNFKYEE